MSGNPSGKQLIGRTVWLIHDRVKPYLRKVPDPSVALLVIDYYDARYHCRTPDGTEVAIRGSAVSLVPPDEQRRIDAESRTKRKAS